MVVFFIFIFLCFCLFFSRKACREVSSLPSMKTRGWEENQSFGKSEAKGDRKIKGRKKTQSEGREWKAKGYREGAMLSPRATGCPAPRMTRHPAPRKSAATPVHEGPCGSHRMLAWEGLDVLRSRFWVCSLGPP